MKPIVKWAGGKSRLLPELLRRVPESIGTYVEPFMGGAALFFALAEERATGVATDGAGGVAHTFERAILVDQNADLVACYRAVRDRVDDVIEALAPYKYDRELYYEVRARDPKKMDDVARAARLIFLNRTCYNGLWRVNSKGGFNVPFGRYKNPRILDRDNLRAAARLLAGVEIRHGDFHTATRDVGKGDFVYFDPPYVPVSRTADFTAYAAEKFGPEDQTRLRDCMLDLRRRGVAAMLSNADTRETRALYRDLRAEVVLAPRNINSDASKRGDIAELLVMTYDDASKLERSRSRARPRRASASKVG